ncbi:uncharacterized protein [Nicotiana sylvestris]|uniref:uncharacterized protein n=1 Tax=Nicotiana sylvestris TaxID=4096 RepID=UPI00388CB1BB
MSAPPGNWEAQSTARPPLFNGQYYSWWKNRMKDHIIGEYYELWDIVTDGPLETIMKNEEGVVVPKTRADRTAEDLKKWEKNAKAKKCLVCGLGPDEYSRIQSCTTAKEIWDTLQVDHEETPQVKRSRGTLLYSQYENFTMKEGETIQEMYTRFTTLTNKLKSLGRIILEEDKVKKILTRVLPVSWESNIATLKLDELIENLTAYELRRQTMKMDTPKKERSLALRIAEGSDLEDDEMAMITREFKKNKDSTRAMVTAWGETSDEDLEDEAKEEQALMAIGESDDEQEVLELDNSVLELRSENLKLKLGTGKKIADHTYLTLEENLVKMKDELYKKDELIKVLKEDLRKVKHELDRTYKWNKASDALSWLQEHRSSNKRGLGYGTQPPKCDSRSKYLTLPENKICTHYGKAGHYKNECNAKEKASQKNKVFVQEKNKLPGWVQVKRMSQIWYMDSGCSKHMTGNKDQFLSLENLKGGNVSFGNGKKGEIIGVGKVGKTDSHSIENVYLIDGLKYSLISVSQLYDRGNQLASIRSDHGTEFKNSKFVEFCDKNGIDHNFSAPRIPQQNGVVERKNRTVKDMARTMLLSSKLPHSFWAEAVNTACYIINRCMTRPLVEKTPYELLKGRKPNISYLRTFGCKCYVHNNGKDSLVFDETNILSERQEHEDEAIGLGNLTGGTNQGEIESNPLEELVHELVPQQQNIGETSSRNQLVVKPHKYQSSHPIENIITDPTSGEKTRSQLKNLCAFDAFLSLIEPKNVVEALEDAD